VKATHEVGRVPRGWRNEYIKIWKSLSYFEVSVSVCTTARRTQRRSSTVYSRNQVMLDGMQLNLCASHDLRHERYEAVPTHSMKAYSSTYS